MIKAVIFDLDGVLVNMPEGHYQALNQALSLFGLSIQRNEHIEFFNGFPTRKKLAELEKRGCLPSGLIEFINGIKQKYTKELISKFCVPDYSKLILFKHLKNKGYKLGCCSNSIKETLHLMLKCAGLFEDLDVIIGNDQVTNPKPAPDIYLESFKALKIKPEECIVVEDAPPGILAAKRSGAKVIEVRGVEDVDLSLFDGLLDL